MDVDEPTDQRAQVELRTKKTEAQRALQAAFRNSFHQTRLKDAFRASFINTVASTDAEDEGEPSLSVSRAPTPDERSKASADETEGTASSSSTSTSSSLSDEDKAVLGRISRMSLHEDEFGNLLCTPGTLTQQSNYVFQQVSLHPRHARLLRRHKMPLLQHGVPKVSMRRLRQQNICTVFSPLRGLRVSTCQAKHQRVSLCCRAMRTY